VARILEKKTPTGEYHKAKGAVTILEFLYCKQSLSSFIKHILKFEIAPSVPPSEEQTNWYPELTGCILCVKPLNY
jgi:hypothetical protein